MTTILAAAAMISPQAALKQTYVFPGMPTMTVPADVAQPEVMWHSVTITLAPATAKIDAVTLYRNVASTPAVAMLTLPVYVVGEGVAAPQYDVLWGDAPLAAGQKRTPFKIGLENIFFRNRGATHVHQTAHQVTLPPKSQRSLKTTITVLISKIDLDGVARQVSYRFEPQPNMLSRLQVSVKYTPELVFRPIGATPEWGNWQIGARGAYMKRENINLPEAREMSFQYYPNEINPSER